MQVPDRQLMTGDNVATHTLPRKSDGAIGPASRGRQEQPSGDSNPNPKRFVPQHVDLNITKDENESIKVSNTKLIQKLWMTHGLEQCNATQMPYSLYYTR